MIDSRRNPYPECEPSDLTKAEYVLLLRQQKNEQLFMPLSEEEVEGGLCTLTYAWYCTDCTYRTWLTFPDSQFPALYPHIDIQTTQLRGTELITATLVRPVCPECESLAFEPVEHTYSDISLEFRGATVRCASERDAEKIHIDE